MIGFRFASDWLRDWRKFSKPITERSKAKPIQSQITFDTQLKIALFQNLILGRKKSNVLDLYFSFYF